ncbi:NADH dehydrogenase [ubiquinone] 1 alpha subcomplex subunit 2 [Paragonimus heterotremus]|uniref:NADH dehydrogenase [ubiquinone] 1 alpha subcomplex subunit 2 n=1 Tax=Paragonimus heterotremus TaxID=100268 RepID=A0A8J4T5G8_9TREM|nr:NADH dehydrogenase [ubiquinone] 1 alpha subcomplex subunit 2 [Paragonimus heterotremus]
MASVVKFGPRVKELRLLLSQSAPSSRGLREFLANHYITLKNANPNLKLMVREAQNVSPKCYARYEYGEEAFVSVVDNTAEEILEKLKGLNRA